MQFDELNHALSARGFLPQSFSAAAEARQAALDIIGDRSVGIGGSATVRDMGLYEALAQRGNPVHWHWKVAKPNKQRERDAALTADVYLSSANAILTDGRILTLDGTANRVAGLIYGPPAVIVIAGRNKIVSSIDEGIQRTRRDCCPENARRLGLDNPCARTGRCADCRTASRMCNVITIHEAPTRVVKEFHVLLVDEDLGL